MHELYNHNIVFTIYPNVLNNGRLPNKLPGRRPPDKSGKHPLGSRPPNRPPISGNPPGRHTNGQLPTQSRTAIHVATGNPLGPWNTPHVLSLPADVHNSLAHTSATFPPAGTGRVVPCADAKYKIYLIVYFICSTHRMLQPRIRL
jgi:hypothetical protein